MRTLGIYVQIPFCASKCSFCNFSSQVSRESVIAGYVRALGREIGDFTNLAERAGISGDLAAIPVETIYVGGGTPTILGAERLASMTAELQKHFRADAPVEFTIEVTPGSIDQDGLAVLRRMGVNRLSIGAQTFLDRELRWVGRLHAARETTDLVAAARRAGFTNVSLDLIAGLPYQTQDSWRESLDAAAALWPEHVSAYIFDIDGKSRLGGEVLRHGTRFHSDAVPGEEFVADAYEFARRFLRSHGYRRYEISNFALPGCESLHNRKYWDLEAYVGLGAGAHSFDGERRWSNVVSPTEYQDRLEQGESPIAEVRRLTPDEIVEEFFFLGLRKAEGVDLSPARQRWGNALLACWEPVIVALVRQGLLKRDADRIWLAEDAYLTSNEIFQEFLLAPEEVR